MTSTSIYVDLEIKGTLQIKKNAIGWKIWWIMRDGIEFLLLKVDLQAGDAKRLACAMARSERTKSALDPTHMDTYVQHFRSTFGHIPTATAQLDEELLELTDPQAAFVPREQSIVMNFISHQDVINLCNTSPNGKACGADGLYGELVSLCPETAGFILTDFFWLLTALNIIPSSWQTALVALVWKKNCLLKPSDASDEKRS